MSRKIIARSVTLAVIAVSFLASTSANAGSDNKSGKRRGPPPVAFEVCADQAEGASCSFEARRGDVTGTCIVPPRGDEALVCAPEGGAPKDRDEQPEQ